MRHVADASGLMMQTFRVKADDAGIRLDRWFKRHFPDLPHGQLQKACRKGLVRVNHAKSKTDQRLALSDEITVKFLNLLPPEKADDSSLSPQMIIQTQGWVLWENNDVIVINKPAGLATQGGSKLTDHLDRRLPALQQGRDTPPKLVHRLDKDTSGALLLARSAASAAEYARLFQTRAVQKTYLALLAGVPVPKDGEIESKMEKSGIGKEKMTDSAAGKKAVTAYRVLDYAHDRAALVELQPITGRTHQLRLHMQQLGCPILGDGKYGGASAFLEGLPLPRQLHLHAWQLHIHSKGIEVTAPLPAHLKRSMECLGLTLAQSGLGQKDKKKEKR